MAEITRRKFTQAFKKKAVDRLLAGESLGEISRQHDLQPSLLARWRRKYQALGAKGLAPAQRGARSRSPGAHIKTPAGPTRQLADFRMARSPAPLSDESDMFPSEDSMVTHLLAVLGRVLGENQALREQLGARRR